MRRSLKYDQYIKTIGNEKLCFVELNSSTKSNQAEECPKEVLNEEPIVISDTDSYESCRSDEFITPKSPIKLNKNLLSEQKFIYINGWVNNVNEQHNKTAFSDVSTICGDVGEYFLPKEKGNAINSTFIQPGDKRFDEYFIKEIQRDTEDSFENQLHQSVKNLEIEDSFEKIDIGYDQNLSSKCSGKNWNSELNKDNSFQSSKIKSFQKLTEDTPPTLQGLLKSNILQKYYIFLLGEPEILKMGTLLDSIYGKKWREKQDLVLPKSEPRKNNKYLINDTNSERYV